MTANARHHHDELRALGADTEVEGEYDVILELVGGENLATNLEKLALKGRISMIGTGAGSQGRDRVRLADGASAAGSSPRTCAPHRRGEGARSMRLARRDPRRSNDCTVPVDETFPLERAQEAYERFARGGKFGKLVICP